MELRKNISPLQFILYVDANKDSRIIALLDIDNIKYSLYQSTGLNSKYPDTWLSFIGIETKFENMGWIKKPSKYMETLNTSFARLLISEPSESEKKAVTQLEEVLIIYDDFNHSYKLGCCDLTSKAYKEVAIDDQEFSQWMNVEKVKIKPPMKSRPIMGTGQKNRITNNFIQNANAMQAIEPLYPLNKLVEYYGNRYDASFIEFLFLNDFEFICKAKENSLNEFLCRFGNSECMCISYLIVVDSGIQKNLKL